MKDCGIVKDLLPLVAEQLASEESTAFVKEHLKTCADCKAAFDAMQAPVEAEPAAPLKTVRRTVKRRGLLIAGLIACLVAALIFGVFARLMKPNPIRSVDEVFDTVTVSVPKTGAEYEADQWELFLSDNTATSSLSVTPEVMKLEVESDGMVYRDGACNNTDLFWLLDRRQTSLSDVEALAYEAVQEIARQQGWILFDTTPHPKTGRRYPDLIIPDRVSVEMWTEPGIYLQIMYGGTTLSNHPSKVDDLLSGNTADRSLRKDPSNKTMSIAAYTTYMERIKAKLGLQAGISRSDGFVMDLDELDEISFEPYNNTDREVLYVREGYTPEAGFALPRLVLNYYFLIAAIGTAILALVWLVLRLCKKRKASRVLGVLLILAGSFVLAFLAAGFPATTIAPVRELAFVLVIALLLIGAGLCGWKLLRKE